MKRGWRQKAFDLYEKRRRAFWVLHSVWALATGLVVVVLAHESYHYGIWVLAFLVVTWVSTLFFSRLSSEEPVTRRARLGHEFASYLTRVMYQETLFFLLPFYYYSTTLDSPNVLFFFLLIALAVVACLDLIFDDLLRRHRWFGLAFFAVVSFAALNFLLPLVLGLRLEIANPVAGALGLGTALPLVYGLGDLSDWRVLGRIVLAGVFVVLVLTWGLAFVPPVPLQLEDLTFARDVEPETLEPIDPLSGTVARSEVGGNRLAVIARIFAPRRLEAEIELRWLRDGKLLEVTRELAVSPHEIGFRVWDTVSSEQGPLPVGVYRVAVRTTRGQLVGRQDLRLIE